MLDVVEGMAGQVVGFGDWRQNVEKAILRYEKEDAACDAIPTHDPPTIFEEAKVIACKAKNYKNVIDDVQRLTKELTNLGNVTTEIIDTFSVKMAQCFV